MEYSSDVVYKQPNERAWVTYIRGKVFQENNSFSSLVVGKTGSGKSYGVLRLCQELDPDFQLEGNWFFRAGNFMKAFTRYYKDKENSKRGKIWVFDEAGVELNSLKYNDIVNKAYSSLFQTSRFRNYIFFGTVPQFSFISKQTRLLMHHRIDAEGVERNKGILRPRCLEYNDKQEKFYSKMLICIDEDGSEKQIDTIRMPLASKKLITEYEKIRAEFADELNEKITQEMNENEEHEAPMPESYTRVIDHIKENKKHQEIAEEMDLSLQRVRDIIQTLRKRGWDFNYNKEGNKIFNPDTKKWEIYPKTKSLNTS